MTGDVLLHCVGVNKAYGGVRAVVDVSLEIRAGEILGLVGPNGAGKTTLVDILGGEQDPDTGEVLLGGKRLTGDPSRRASRGLGRTFQHPQLANELTVAENIVVGLAASRMNSLARVVGRVAEGMWRGRLPATQQARAIADSLNLADITRPASLLTIGELRLVEVARALIQDPDVVLLDEPFAGMDGRGVEGVRDALTEVLRRGHGVLIVDHNIDIVASLVHRIVLMDRGSIVFDGDPDACLRSEEMQRVYFGTKEAS